MGDQGVHGTWVYFNPDTRVLFTVYLTTGGVVAYQFLLGDSGTSQKLALLFKPDAAAFTLTPATELAGLLGPWQADVDGDAVFNDYDFTAPRWPARPSWPGCASR